MARIRSLKPDFFKDEDLATLSFDVRLFFAGLWNFADKAGRLEDRPLRLKAEIFPYDDVDVKNCLDSLSKPKNGSGKPFIQRYEVNGEKFIQIINWEKHQKPHPTEKESEIPPYNPLLEKGKGMGMVSGYRSVVQAQVGLSNVYLHVKDTLNEIIADFNEVFGTRYKTNTKIVQDLVSARIKDKFTLDDFKTVHRKMLRCWGADEKMCKFLRPQTLYSNKFEAYLNQKEFTTKLSENGVKAYIVGKEWLRKEQEKEKC